MFKCEDVLSELSGYLDNELVADLRRQVEAHLEHCTTCRAVYDSTRKTLRIVTDSGSFELAEDVSIRVAERIRSRISSGLPGSGPAAGS
ncbi:MAG TPA: zf-HC2 domain-containing protein [Terriglobia bacterium]|nr:zf-HC2 domain-containing protein [Terriglobia bacterium]